MLIVIFHDPRYQPQAVPDFRLHLSEHVPRKIDLASFSETERRTVQEFDAGMVLNQSAGAG